MRHLGMAALLLLLLLPQAWALTGCAPPSPSRTSLAASTAPPSATPSPTATTAPPPTTQPATLAPTPTPFPTATATPMASPSPCPTPSPSPAPLLEAVPGEPLPLSLGWRIDANGHLTAARVAGLGDQPSFLLTSLGRTVYALTRDGEIAWRARTAGPVYALALLADGEVAAGDDAGRVTLLDTNGQQLWERDLGTRITALLGGWQGGLLVGGWDERLTFLSTQGQDLWAADLDGPVSGIVGLPGLALAATLDGQVQAFHPTGDRAWRFKADTAVTELGVMRIGETARILAGLQDGQLLALDDQGALLWRQAFGTGGPVWAVGNVRGDTAPEIVVGMGGATPLLALLSAGGEVLWRLAVPAPVGAVACLDLDGDGVPEILAGLSSGQVQAYDGLARLRGTVHAGLPVWKLEAAQGGGALVLADVIAWRIECAAGPKGGAWLPVPALVPAPAEPTPPEQEPVPGEAILAFLGDVSPGRSMEAQLARLGPAYPWSGLESLLGTADLAVANLEGVLTTEGDPLDKSYLIRAHPRWGQTLVAGGIDLVTLANNHALDYGSTGLDETLGTLEALAVAVVGAGAAREAAHRPVLFTLEGVQVAVLGYAAARWNGSVDMPQTDRIAWARVEEVEADVRAVRQHADVVIVLLHAGTEYASGPSPDQVEVAHAAIEAGADLVVGHHPHVTQTVERYRQGLIVYSLGDALFDIPRPAAMRGHLLRVHVTRAGLARAELWPFWIEDAIRPRLLDDGQGGAQMQVIYP